jgi:hypothetical protein
MSRVALVLVLVVGCGGAQKPKSLAAAPNENATQTSEPIPMTAGPDCAIVADRLATVAHAETPDRQAEARDMLRTRCTDDKWSDDARNCFATVENDAEIEGCASKLTAAQRSALHAEHAAPADQPNALVPADKESAPRGGTRSPTHRNSSDPCEGGE